MAAVGLTYGVGLLLWQVYAFVHHLGYVSALNPQYFVSGGYLFVASILVTVILGASLVILESVKRQADKIVNKVTSRSIGGKIHRFILQVAFVALFVLVFGVGIVAYYYAPKTPFTLFPIILEGALLLWFLFALSQDPGDISVKEWAQRSIRRSTILVPAILIAGLLYSFILYPYIPQEFGGGCPKLCYVDFSVEKTSDWMICELSLSSPVLLNKNDQRLGKTQYDACKDIVTQILSKRVLSGTIKEANRKPLDVLHSKPVELWFDSSDQMILRTSSVFHPGEKTIVRIPSNLFMAITIHDDLPPSNRL